MDTLVSFINAYAQIIIWVSILVIVGLSISLIVWWWNRATTISNPFSITPSAAQPQAAATATPAVPTAPLSTPASPPGPLAQPPAQPPVSPPPPPSGGGGGIKGFLTRSIEGAAVLVLLLVIVVITTIDWQWGLVVIMSIALIAEGIRTLAKNQIMFMFVENNCIYLIERGTNVVRMVANLDDAYVRGFEVADGKPIFSFISNWGIRWIGPFTHVSKWKLVHERVNPNIDADTPYGEWIIREEKPRDETFLWFKTLHHFSATSVEIADSQTINIRVVAKLRARRPVIAIKQVRGQFYDMIGAQITQAINNVFRGKTPTVVLAGGRGENDPFCQDILKELEKNAGLVTNTGYEVVGLLIEELSLDPETARNTRELAFARRRQEIAVVEAETRKKTAEAIAEAANADILIVGKNLTGAVLGGKEPDGSFSHADLLASVTQIITNERLASGGNTQVDIGRFDVQGNLRPPRRPKPPRKPKGGN